MKITLRPRYGATTTITEGRMPAPNPYPSGIQEINGQGLRLRIIHNRELAENTLRREGRLNERLRAFVRIGALHANHVDRGTFSNRVYLHVTQN